MEVIMAVTPEDQSLVFELRKRIFVDEQGVPEENEFDEYESTSLHFLALDQGIPVGAGRLREYSGEAKIERVCVLNSLRKSGTGRLVMEAMENEARKMGLTRARLHAQTQAAGFYQRIGYLPASGIFMEENIPHILMIKEL